MFYVERYLVARERNDLTEAEKQSLSICSSKWSGIMMHLDELREAIRLNKPMDEVTQLLQRCMNDGKTVYVGNEPNAVEDEEKQEIVKFIETLQKGEEEEYRFSLTERSRVFANTLIQELHDRDYFISYTYENHGGVRGTRRLTRGKEVSLLERAEYHYSKRTLKIRKKTEEDNNDSGILEARGFDFGLRF